MLDNAHLKQLVLDKLEWDNQIDCAHIGVSTTCCGISQNGHVSSHVSKFAVAKTSSVDVSIDGEASASRKQFNALLEKDRI